MVPESSLYFAANIALFAVVLISWFGLFRPGQIRDVVPRALLALFIVLQGVAIVWSVTGSGPLAVTHPPLAIMLVVEAAAFLFLVLERAGLPTAASPPVATLEFLIHSCGLVLGPLLPEGALPVTPLAQTPWYLLHVLCALVAFGAYLCAAGGVIAQMLPRLLNLGAATATRASSGDGQVFSRRALAIAFPSLTGSLIARAVWTFLGWGSYWSWRPAGVWLLVLWLILTMTLHVRDTPRWQGRITAMLTILGFLLALSALPLLGSTLAPV